MTLKPVQQANGKRSFKFTKASQAQPSIAKHSQAQLSFSFRPLTSLARPSLSFRSLFGPLGSLLGEFLPLLGPLGSLFAALGALLAALGRSWAALGAVLAALGAVLGGHFSQGIAS